MLGERSTMPVQEPSGSLLLRVWCEGEGANARVVARVLEWNSTSEDVPSEPQYASGVDEIVEKVRRWIIQLVAHSADA